MTKPKFKIPKDYAREWRHFILEKDRIEKHFPCFHCHLQRNHLTCHGTIQPEEGCDRYKVTIKYLKGSFPKVYITEPFIRPSSKCHIYSDGSLCLYDYRESPWNELMMIHETIIPWTAEWLVFYELWKITGEWLGLAAPHGAGGKSPERRSSKLRPSNEQPKRIWRSPRSGTKN
jgi:hypothetical protein